MQQSIWHVKMSTRSNGETATSLSDDNSGRLMPGRYTFIKGTVQEQLRYETGQESIARSCRVFHFLRIHLFDGEFPRIIPSGANGSGGTASDYHQSFV